MKKRGLIIAMLIVVLLVAGGGAYWYFFRYKADVVVAPVCGDGICQSGESVASCPNDCFKVITSSNNVTDFQKQLNPTDFGNGCTGAPSACVAKVKAKVELLGVEKTGEYLAITKDPALIADYALQYSQLSLQNPWLKETFIDDFYYTYREWKTAQVDYKALLETVIANTKQANPNLKFGIILYEEQLETALLSDAELPPETREKINLVHLFVHYREDGLNYRNYVNRVKTLFPNAKIVAGAYDYDRIDYMPCAYSTSGFTRPIANNLQCTAEEELDYYKQLLEIQAEMLKNGEIYALHFYPGPSDTDTGWYGFDSPTNCLAERKEQCIQNTIKLNEITFSVLNQARGIATAPVDTTPPDTSTAVIYNAQDKTPAVFEDESASNNPSAEVSSTQESQTTADSQPAVSSETSNTSTTTENTSQEEDLTTSGPESSKNFYISIYIAFILTVAFALLKGLKNNKYPY